MYVVVNRNEERNLGCTGIYDNMNDALHVLLEEVAKAAELDNVEDLEEPFDNTMRTPKKGVTYGIDADGKFGWVFKGLQLAGQWQIAEV